MSGCTELTCPKHGAVCQQELTDAELQNLFPGAVRWTGDDQ